MTTDHLAAVLAALDAATEAERHMDDAPWSVADSMVLDSDRRPLTLWGSAEDAAGAALARNQWPALLRLARAYAGWRLDQTIETWDALESAFADLGGL